MAKPLTLRDANNPVIFVNQIAGVGFLNDNVNLTFSTLFFTPSADHPDVDPDPVITCRLRMDTTCAQVLYDRLGQQLEAIRQARNAGPSIAANHDAGKLN
jgi:hypothetical protein